MNARTLGCKNADRNPVGTDGFAAVALVSTGNRWFEQAGQHALDRSRLGTRDEMMLVRDKW